MTTTTKTRKAKAAPAKAKAKAAKGKAAVKRSSRKAALETATKAPRKPRKASKGKKPGKASKASTRKGGGKALGDFGNEAVIRVLKPKDFPARRDCFKTGLTVAKCLALQKAKGYRGRRKFIRASVAAGRIALRSK